jgi:hypothetical protein
MKMPRKAWLWGALQGALLCAALALPAQADVVGAVEAVKRNVYGKPPTADETPKYAGNPVMFQETIKTLVDSAALIRFEDGSKLTVGAKSVIQLDEFVYDPAKNTGKNLLSVTGGAIRFLTGSMPKGNTTIVTPTATMVLRGTEVTVQVAPDGTTTLNVISGSVDTTSSATNQNATVTPGHSLKIGRSGFAKGGSGATGGTPDATPGDLGEQNPTGDPIVDNGISGSQAGTQGSRNITSQKNDSTSSGSPVDSGATSNKNAGSGHGNNGGL